MSRRRYRYIKTPTGETISEEVNPDYTGNGEPGGGRLELMLDSHYDGLRATDGTPIDSRAKHRQYMKANNLTTADDFNGAWRKAAAQRADFFTTGGDHAARREAVERAVHQLERHGRGR